LDDITMAEERRDTKEKNDEGSALLWCPECELKLAGEGRLEAMSGERETAVNAAASAGRQRVTSPPWQQNLQTS